MQVPVVKANAAERRVSDFNIQNLANTAWTFATVRQQDAQLFAALSRAAERCMNEFDTVNAETIASFM